MLRRFSKMKLCVLARILVIMGVLLTLVSGQTHAQNNEDKPEKATDEEQAVAPELVTVVANRKAFYTEITQDSQKLVEMPGALGDPLGAISALPGVITPNDGGEPAVRGSSPDDNRYFVDGIPVGYIFHEFNTSIFDENTVQDFQLFSAGFGAQYSDATGAIFDIRLRDPKQQKINTKVSVSLLRAGVFVEGGVTDNSAFYVSARKGLIQFFLPEEDEASEEGIRVIDAPADDDYQFKYLVDVSDTDQVTLTMAGASDFATAEITDMATFVQRNPDFAGDAKIDNRFDSQGVIWSHDSASGMSSTLSLVHYEDTEKLIWGEGFFEQVDLGNNVIKGHIRMPLSAHHTATLGGEFNRDTFDYSIRSVLFICTDFDVDCQDGRRDIVTEDITLDVDKSMAYLIDAWQVTPSVTIESGVQWQRNNYTGEDFVHPRIAATWDATTMLTLSTSYGKYNRFPDIETILPVIGNPALHSPLSEHYTLGVRGEFGDEWSWSLEAYYKTLEDLPLALDDTQDDSEDTYSNDVDGTARGFDLLINKNQTDRWYGWVSLSYSRSDRTNRRTGLTRLYTLDTPVVLNVVAQFQVNEDWKTGFRFTAKSGEATTEIIGIKENPDFPGRYLPVYGEANEERFPTYSRLDLRAEREITLFGKEGLFFIDVLNALGRENVTDRNLDYEKVNETGMLHIEDEVDFGAFGSLGLSFTF